MGRELFTSGQVAVQIGIPRSHLLYLIERGDLPGPSVQVPGRRLYTAADVARIAQALIDRGEGKPVHDHPDA